MKNDDLKGLGVLGVLIAAVISVIGFITGSVLLGIIAVIVGFLAIFIDPPEVL